MKSPPPEPFGQVIRIPLPLDSKAVARVRRAVRQTLDKARTLGSRPVLIFEFDAARGGAEASQGTSFGDAYELANFLSSEELNGATTVAYLPQSIRGHAVLLALACDQIIMADGTTIGAAGADEKVIHETVQSAYREIAGRRRTLPEELAVALLLPRADVLMVHTEASTEYVTPAELEELRKRHTIQSQEVVVRQGEPAQFSAADLRRWGFVKRLAANRLEVVRALGIAVPGRRRGRVAWRAVAGGPRRLRGPIDGEKVDQIERLIQDEMRLHEVNFVCLQIDSFGGTAADCLRLAGFLAFDLDPSVVRTVAYIPEQARGRPPWSPWPATRSSCIPGRFWADRARRKCRTTKSAWPPKPCEKKSPPGNSAPGRSGRP